MKLRIKRVVDFDLVYYFPQRRRFFFWFSIERSTSEERAKYILDKLRSKPETSYQYVEYSE